MQRPHCEEHPQSPAVARCVGCGKYLCRECIVEIGARPYCGACLEEAKRRQETGRMEASGAPAIGPSPQAPPPGQPPLGAPQPGEGRPVGARVVATCAFHPGVRAVTRCSACGALICSGCQRIVGDRRLCEGCFQRSYALARRLPPGNRGVLQPRQGPSFAGISWKLWPGLAFLPVPFILSGVMTYMMRQGEEVSVGVAQLLLSTLLYPAMLFFAFITVSRYGPALGEMGLHGRNLPASLGLGIIGGSLAFWMAVAAGALSVALFNGVGWIEKWLQGFSDVNVKNITGTDLLIAGIIIIVAAPICEEIFFRGYLYPAMRNRLGVWGAIFLNGFLFSAVHFSLFGLIGRTLAGALFCMLYEYNDNLWSPITAHAINNFVAFFLPLVYVSTA